jgi:thiamine pyrophosphate-dependent acetolactate synthase large subunit-like protein
LVDNYFAAIDSMVAELERVIGYQVADGANAIISLDCGANTHFAARGLRLRSGQRFTGTGMLVSMAPGLPYAIAARASRRNTMPKLGGPATHDRSATGVH